MRVCLICEGSYPYVAGGVSGWVQMLCQNVKDIEFTIFSIATTREEMSKYKYQLPDNVKEVNTVYLSDESFKGGKSKVKMSEEEVAVLRELILGESEKIQWKKTLDFIKKYRTRMSDILMSEGFYDICLEAYRKTNQKELFHAYLWSFRSMYFPLMSVLASDIPKADIYHSLSTGYAGVYGSAASYIEGKPFILSEHGIYTREREEDIIRADWVKGDFKELWINFFKKVSIITYQQADIVTTLFEVNKNLQIELGCPAGKIEMIPNGVDVEQFAKLESKNILKRDCFNIGTVLRVVPIKDVKTMILAYDLVREQRQNSRLYIMGNYDESPEYYEECLELVEALGVDGVTFLGQVKVQDYLPDIDLLLLSSISEGQPLAVLEGLAAGIPFVCTNVGDCRSLLEGSEDDSFGKAGYIVPLMDSKAMANAIITAMDSPEELKQMGINGQKRVQKYYRREMFLNRYCELYKEVGERKNGWDRI